MIVALFWVVGGSRFILGNGEWWWVILGCGEC